MTVIYIDSVFALNALMDYLLLLSAARLAGLPLRRRRYVLGALAGGAYAAAVFLPGLSFLAASPVKLAAGVLLGLIAYGGEEKLLRLLLLFFAVSCAMAGCVLGLGLLAGGGVPVVNGVFYTNVNLRILVIAGAAAYAVLSVVFRAAASHGVKGTLLPVRVCLGGRTAELTALADSGSGLRAPDGRGVLVTAPGALRGILPPAAAGLLTPERLWAPEELLEPLRAAAPADALSRRGNRRRAAADGPHGLDGNQRDPISGTDGGFVPLSAGSGVFGAVGRSRGKGRERAICWKNYGGCWFAWGWFPRRRCITLAAATPCLRR